jgi:hypothetical protein
MSVTFGRIRHMAQFVKVGACDFKISKAKVRLGGRERPVLAAQDQCMAGELLPQNRHLSIGSSRT